MTRDQREYKKRFDEAVAAVKAAEDAIEKYNTDVSCRKMPRNKPYRKRLTTELSMAEAKLCTVMEDVDKPTARQAEIIKREAQERKLHGDMVFRRQMLDYQRKYYNTRARKKRRLK